MAIPSVKTQEDGIHLMWIRKDWLDALGLEPPRTIDDVERVACVVENNMGETGKTIGLAGPDSNGKMYAHFLESANNLYGFDPIFSAFGAYPGYWLEGEDGEPVYGSILPEVKEALAKLREWYAAGLMIRRWESATIPENRSSLVKPECFCSRGGWATVRWPMRSVKIRKQTGKPECPAAGCQRRISPAHEHTDGRICRCAREGYEHPEAAIKLLNLLVRDESKFDIDAIGIGYYPLRIVFAPSDEMSVTAQALRDVLSGAKKPEDFYPLVDQGYKLLANDVDNIHKVKLEPYDRMDIEYWDPQADMSVWTRAYSTLVENRADSRYTDGGCVQPAIFPDKHDGKTLGKPEDDGGRDVSPHRNGRRSA